MNIAAAGATPEVTPVETGTFLWRTVPLHMLPQDDPGTMLASILPAGTLRRQSLMRIAAAGRTSLGGRTALAAASDHAAPEFAYLELDAADLATDCDAEDLDLIDRAGALREAAETLRAESLDEAKSLAERQLARAALVRLFSYCQKIAS